MYKLRIAEKERVDERVRAYRVHVCSRRIGILSPRVYRLQSYPISVNIPIAYLPAHLRCNTCTSSARHLVRYKFGSSPPGCSTTSWWYIPGGMATINSDSACRLPDSIAELRARKNPAKALLADSDVDRIVERRLRTRDFRLLHWNLDRLGETNGFLGQYFCLSVIIRTADRTRCLKFFAKTPPPLGTPMHEFLVRLDTFNKEITVYEDLLVKMGKGEGMKWLPECYLGKTSEIIVLEDAREESYANPDKYIPLDEEHLVQVIRALSTFHSRSVILEEKLRRTGRTIQEVYGHLLCEVLFVKEDERSRRMLSSSIKGFCAMVDFAESLKEEQKTVVKERAGKWCRALFTLLGPSSEFRNAICHRDVWANNIMFKHDQQGTPIGCYIIDFQFLCYSPPTNDLIFLLYLTTDRATRDRNYDRFFNIYYDVMRQELEAEGFNIEKIMPWSSFLESCSRARQIGLTYAAANLQIMLLTSQAIADHFVGGSDQLENILYGDERAALVRHQCRVHPAYRKRMVEIVEEIWERMPDQPAKL